jgi:hypothetical protein
MAWVSLSRPFSESSCPRAAISTRMSWSGASLTTSSKNRRTSGGRSASSSAPKDPSSPSQEPRNVSLPLLAAACGEPLPDGHPPGSACRRLMC